MSAGVHLLLVISTILAAGVAWMIVGLTPATVISVTAAIVGALLYIRPLDILGDLPGDPKINGRGGSDAE